MFFKAFGFEVYVTRQFISTSRKRGLIEMYRQDHCITLENDSWVLQVSRRGSK